MLEALSQRAWAFAPLLLGLLLAPLLSGIINRVKAVFAGRTGKPLLQLYFDLAKLWRKSAVYSRTTTFIFRISPLIGLCAVVLGLAVLPLGGFAAWPEFSGNFILLAYLLGLARMAIILGALDTASSFEGMGASREAAFSALAEPALMLCFLVLAKNARGLELGAMLGAGGYAPAAEAALVPAVLFLLLLAENCRIPVDDPNTHLELTMIHEAMVLDHSGPDLGFILYAASLKLWLFCALLCGVVLPQRPGQPWLDLGMRVLGIFLCAVLAGVAESVMARLRLTRVPKLLAMAGALSGVALILALWR